MSKLPPRFGEYPAPDKHLTIFNKSIQFFKILRSSLYFDTLIGFSKKYSTPIDSQCFLNTFRSKKADKNMKLGSKITHDPLPFTSLYISLIS